MMHLFWKYHVRGVFEVLTQARKQAKEDRDNAKVDGAYTVIGQLKEQLKLFDKALERIYKDKASKQELDTLRLSVD